MKSGGSRIRNIDFLKGILAIFIVTLHFGFPEGFPIKVVFPYTVSMAVPMFMFISAYLSTVSFNRNGIETLADAYKRDFIIPKLLRIIFPFVIYFIAEQIMLRVWHIYTVGIFKYGIVALFFDFLTGGAGQGSYYFPVIIQFILLFPLIYFGIKKHGFKGLCTVFFINIGYEIIKQAYGMPDYEYRLLVFRYLFLIAAGCYVAFKHAEEVKETCNVGRKVALFLISIVCGAAFIYLFTYTAYEGKIITYWTSQSVFCCFYIIPLMALYVEKVHVKFAPLELVGKASWHIFLFQMLYYLYYYSRDSYIIESNGLRYLLSVLVCVTGGVLFYCFEKCFFKVKTLISR